MRSLEVKAKRESALPRFSLKYNIGTSGGLSEQHGAGKTKYQSAGSSVYDNHTNGRNELHHKKI